MPKSKPKSNSAPSRLTSQKLANAFPRANLDERKVGIICVKAGVMNKRGEGYEFLPAVDAILTYYKTGYEKRDVAGESDRARKNKAEADTAELDALTAAGKTCLRSDATLYIQETRIAIRRAIETEAILTETQKKRVLSKLAEIRLPSP